MSTNSENGDARKCLQLLDDVEHSKLLAGNVREFPLAPVG